MAPGRVRRFIESATDPPIDDHPADRGDVDHAPAAAREHGAADHLGTDEAVGEVEIDEALPGFEVGVFDRHVEVAAAHVVDQDVDGPGLRKHALAELLAQLRLSDIAGKGPGLAATLPYFVAGLP